MPATEKTKKATPAATGKQKAAKSEKPTKEPSPVTRIGLLALGDLVVFLIFATIGRNSHGEASGFAAIPQIFLTALPFAAGWFIVAPFVGAYRRELSDQPKAMGMRTALAWLLSWPVGLLFRWFFVDRLKNPPTTAGEFASFATVTFIFNMLVLLVWRVGNALNNNARKNLARAKK